MSRRRASPRRELFPALWSTVVPSHHHPSGNRKPVVLVSKARTDTCKYSNAVCPDCATLAGYKNVTFLRFFKIAVARPFRSNGHRLPPAPRLSFLPRNVTPYFIRGGNPANPVNVIRRRSLVPRSPDPSRFTRSRVCHAIAPPRPIIPTAL